MHNQPSEKLTDFSLHCDTYVSVKNVSSAVDSGETANIMDSEENIYLATGSIKEIPYWGQILAKVHKL